MNTPKIKSTGATALFVTALVLSLGASGCARATRANTDYSSSVPSMAPSVPHNAPSRIPSTPATTNASAVPRSLASPYLPPNSHTDPNRNGGW